MEEAQFQKPSSFRSIFSVSLEKDPELLGSYLGIGLFFLGALAYLSKSDYVGVFACFVLVAFFKFTLSNLRKFTEQRLILEASAEGIYFPHWNLYLPFNCVKSIAERSETGYIANLGAVTINSLNIFFEVPSEQLIDIRKNLIKRMSWARKLNQQGDRSLVSILIPFTVGKGKPLSFSKDEIFNNLNRMLSDFKSQNLI